MKNLLYLFFVMLTISATAQDGSTYVEVVYELSMDLDPDQVISNIPAQYRAAVEDQVRQEIKDGIKINYILKTNGEESTYQMVEKLNNSQSPAGMITQQIMSQDKGVLYKNLSDGIFLKPYDIMGSKYLIKDNLPDYTWTVSREKEEIAGFDTRKAEGQYNDTISATAYYAPKITLKDGPDRVWGLPGLILKSEFNTNGVDITITALSVAVKEEAFDIEKPKDGKVMTQKEFEEEMKAFQEKMKAMMGDGVDTE